MSDWQAGDLALCVKGGFIASPSGLPQTRDFPKAGRVYLVAGFGRPDFQGSPSLLLDGAPLNSDGKPSWAAYRFRKVTPPAADAFDREVIDLMLGKPEPVK